MMARAEQAPRSTHRGVAIAVGVALIAGTVATSAAQRGRGGAPPVALGPGTIERVTVRDREVLVYLPDRKSVV